MDSESHIELWRGQTVTPKVSGETNWSWAKVKENSTNLSLDRGVSFSFGASKSVQGVSASQDGRVRVLPCGSQAESMAGMAGACPGDTRHERNGKKTKAASRTFPLYLCPRRVQG